MNDTVSRTEYGFFFTFGFTGFTGKAYSGLSAQG